MRTGVPIVIDLDHFEEQVLVNAAKFPTAQIFNRAQWNKREVYTTVVNEDELKNVLDRDQDFVMKKGFNIILTSSTKDEAHL